MTLGQHKAKELMKALKDDERESAANARAREAIEIQAGPFWESLHIYTKTLVDDFLVALPINTGIRCTLVNPNHLMIYRDVVPLLTLDIVYVPGERIDISYRETPPALGNSKSSKGSYSFFVDSRSDDSGVSVVCVIGKDRNHQDAQSLANDICDKVAEFVRHNFTAV